VDEFLQLLEGTFSNKSQAQCHPTRYAHIWVMYKKVSGNRFYAEQAYNYLRNRPYLQYVIDVVEDNGTFRTKNHEIIKTPERYCNGANIEEITDDHLRFREHCDLVFKQVSNIPNIYEGGTEGCQCHVNWGGRDTYIINQIKLTDTELHILDTGRDVNTHEKVWGSDWGHLKFMRQ